MNKIAFMSILAFLLFTPLVSACTISPNSWNVGNVSLGTSTSKSFSIDSTNHTCDISSDTPWITFDRTHFENTTSSFTAVLNIPSNADTGSYTKNILVNGANAVTVTFTATSTATTTTTTLPSSQEGYLEPTFSTLNKRLEVGTKVSRTFWIRNKYPKSVEIRDISFKGDFITTREGITKPVDWVGELGWLEPGKDLTINLVFNTENLPTGTYNEQLEIAYYYEGIRNTLTISFNVVVLEALSPAEGETTPTQTTRSLDLVVNPSSPEPGDYVNLILKDSETGSTIDGTIKVNVFKAGTNEQQSSFDYISPFVVSGGKKYCIDGSAEGYDTVKKCFVVELKLSKIKTSIEEPKPGEEVMIQLMDSLENRVIPTGKLIIDGTEYDTPQVTVAFGKGVHIIEGYANGYKNSSISLSVYPELNCTVKGDKIVGANISVVCNRPVDWVLELRNEETTTIDAGSGESFKFSPEKEGKYVAILNGKELEINVAAPFSIFNLFAGLGDFGKSVSENWYILAGIGVLVILYFGAKKKKRKAKHITFVGTPVAGPLKLKKKEE